MKLTTVQIANFKCIRDPCSFSVSDITCLVGMNESGKTAILEALCRLNPIIPADGAFNVDDDYPRIDAEDYRVEVNAGRRKADIVTRAVFSLSPEDRAALDKEYPGALTASEMVLSKGYGNTLSVELPLNEAAIMQTLLRKAGSPRQLIRAKSLTLSDLVRFLGEPEHGNASVGPVVHEMQNKGIADYMAETYLLNKVPRFMYFDEFYQMAGHVNIEGLIERQKNNCLLESDYPLLGLIDLARLDLREIANPTRALERANRLEGASNHLSATIMQYWSQNAALEMRFDIRPGLPNDPEGMRTGTNLWCHVYNSRQKVCTLLGGRSRGFIWFFSFLAWFSQHKQRGVPLVLLLDEPAIYLHGTAQKDLLRYLEDESRSGRQVIYTTQSPYMINARKFDRVRIVEDKGAQGKQPSSSRAGTCVFTDARDAAEGSILPLTGALADGLHSDLLPGKNTLIVGDIADMLFCATISTLLVAGGALGLDPALTITPMGGAGRLAAYFLLSGSQGDTPAACPVLLNKSALGAMDSPLKDGLLQRQRIFLYGSFTGTQDADVEDMFDQEFYLGLVNDAYHDVLSRPIRKNHLPADDGRITTRVASCLESLSAQRKGRFDRLAPARYFAENGASLQNRVSDETWLRFQEMFKAINAACLRA